MDATLAWTIAGVGVGLVAAVAGTIAAWASMHQLSKARAAELPEFAETIQPRGDVAPHTWNVRVRVVRHAELPRWSIKRVRIRPSAQFEFTLVSNEEPAPNGDSLWTSDRDLERRLDPSAGAASIGPAIFVRRRAGRAPECQLEFILERENGQRGRVIRRVKFPAG